MKTTHRSIPNDIFSVKEGRYRIVIFTHRNEVVVDLWRDEESSQQGIYSFEQFKDALQAVLTHYPPSPPSSDDKEAATAPEGVKKQAWESYPVVGDVVELSVGVNDTRTGEITHIDETGLATIEGFAGKIYHKHLSALVKKP